MMNRTWRLLGATAIPACILLALTVASASPKPAPASKQATAAENVRAVGSSAYFVYPDPKTPGKPLIKLWAKGITAGPSGAGYGGTFHHVSATLFQRGAVSAKLVAPTMQVTQSGQQEQVVGTGRVTVTSLTQSGTSITADRMTWYPRKNTVVAQGHVVYKNGRTGATGMMPQLWARTDLHSISDTPL